MARFKVGDKVRVKKDLVVGDCTCNKSSCMGLRFVEEMLKYKGNIYTIKGFDGHDNYYLNGCEDWRFSDDMVEPVEFTKADLKDGMVVETRETYSDNRYLVLGDKLIQKRAYLGLREYDDDLTSHMYSVTGNKYDIVKVYKSDPCELDDLFDDRYLELIWERKEEEPCKEMTVEEIEKILGHKIKVVGGQNG